MPRPTTGVRKSPSSWASPTASKQKFCKVSTKSSKSSCSSCGSDSETIAMSFRDLLNDTLATLWAHKRRTLLTMFGIAWRIISITVMAAAGARLGVGIQRNQETFGKDVMIVFSGRTSMQAGGSRAGRVVRWYEDDYIQPPNASLACKYVMPE